MVLVFVECNYSIAKDFDCQAWLRERWPGYKAEATETEGSFAVYCSKAAKGEKERGFTSCSPVQPQAFFTGNCISVTYWAGSVVSAGLVR